MHSESDIVSVTHVLGYNIVRFGSVLHTLLKMKNKGNFFFITKKTLTRSFFFFLRNFFGLSIVSTIMIIL